MKQSQHIEVVVTKQSEKTRNLYRARLTASVDCIRHLLRQGLAFRRHDESETSSNRGNFLELLKFVANHNEEIKSVVLKNTPENNQLTSPDIQKDIVHVVALETTQAIFNELGDEFFAILVDESSDILDKEQMVVMLRYVNSNGFVVERFLGIVHVSDTSALSLKKAIKTLLAYFGRGEFNGLKSLILKDTDCPERVYRCGGGIHLYAN